MATQADFIANPWRFLKNNILLVNLSGGTAKVGNFMIVAKPRSAAYALGMFNRASDVFELVPVAAGSAGSFQAWWCPYTQDETHHAVIGAAADFCFTSQIDGCSIGLGHETAAGDKLVVHSNEARVTDPAAQAAAQDAMIRARGGATIRSVFGPASYRVDSKGQRRYEGTVVGWRDPAGAPRGWAFKTQTYELLALAPKRYKLKSLITM